MLRTRAIWGPVYRFLRSDVKDEAQAQRGLLLNGTLLCFGLAEGLYLIFMILLFQPLYIIELIVGIAVTATAFSISKRGHVAVAASAFLTVSFVLLGYVILTSTNYQIAYGPCAIFLTFFVVAASILISPRAPFVYAVMGTFILVGALYTVPLQPAYTTSDIPALNSMSVPIVITWILTFFSWQSGRATASALRRLFIERQALAEANRALDERHTVSAKVSQNVRTLATNLTSATTQQTNGAQEQAAALVQVESAIRELTRTAARIAENAAHIEDAAREADTSAQYVLSVTQLAATSSDDGQQSVSMTIAASEEVNTIYASLTRILIDLAERSLRIKAILDLTQSIADETHLLSLNAAIEAAGTNQNGARFAIVAQRVKELAGRSHDSSNQISQIVRELQARIQSAVMVAESGEKRAAQSVGVAHESGAAMTVLGTTIYQAAEEAGRIVGTAHNLSELAHTIGQATREQQSASAQILATLRAVTVIAESTVATSQKLTQAVRTLDGLSAELADTLTVAA